MNLASDSDSGDEKVIPSTAVQHGGKTFIYCGYSSRIEFYENRYDPNIEQYMT